jgi:hypothetical protein
VPYDEELADRLRAALSTTPRVSEKRMFGGLAFLVDGALVARPGVQRMVMRGREMAGWLRVDDAAADDESSLREWVSVGRSAAAGSLPT